MAGWIWGRADAVRELNHATWKFLPCKLDQWEVPVLAGSHAALARGMPHEGMSDTSSTAAEEERVTRRSAMPESTGDLITIALALIVVWSLLGEPRGRHGGAPESQLPSGRGGAQGPSHR